MTTLKVDVEISFHQLIASIEAIVSEKRKWTHTLTMTWSLKKMAQSYPGLLFTCEDRAGKMNGESGKTNRRGVVVEEGTFEKIQNPSNPNSSKPLASSTFYLLNLQRENRDGIFSNDTGCTVLLIIKSKNKAKAANGTRYDCDAL